MMGDKDFSAQIARLKTANPKADAVFISAIPNEAGLTVKQIREAGPDPSDRERGRVRHRAGRSRSRATSSPTTSTFSTHTYREDNRPEVLAFVKAYENEYGRPPKTPLPPWGSTRSA